MGSPLLKLILNFGVFDELAVILDAFMAGVVLFFPFRMVAPDQLNQVFFRFDVRDTGEFVNFPAAKLAFIGHRRHSSRQQHSR